MGGFLCSGPASEKPRLLGCVFSRRDVSEDQNGTRRSRIAFSFVPTLISGIVKLEADLDMLFDHLPKFTLDIRVLQLWEHLPDGFPFHVFKKVQSYSLIDVGCGLIHGGKSSMAIELDDRIIDAIENGHEIVWLKRTFHSVQERMEAGCFNRAEGTNKQTRPSWHLPRETNRRKLSY